MLRACVLVAATISCVSCSPAPAGPEPESLSESVNTEVTPANNTPPPPTVFDAVASGDTKLLTSIHANGGAIDALNAEGLTPLQCAVSTSDVAMVTLLLDLGVDPDGAPSRMEPPINIAVRRAKETGVYTPDTPAWAILKRLIGRGAQTTRHRGGYISAVQHAMEIQCEACIQTMRETAFTKAVKLFAGPC